MMFVRQITHVSQTGLIGEWRHMVRVCLSVPFIFMPTHLNIKMKVPFTSFYNEIPFEYADRTKRMVVQNILTLGRKM
jgi:hypothetical protein